MAIPDTTRIVVVTVREDGQDWEIEIDSAGLDPWSTLGILRGAYRQALDCLERTDE